MQFPNTTLPVSEYNRFSFRIPVSEYNRAVSESQFPNTTVPVSEYNRRVSEYNRGVSEYNRRVSEYNRPVSEYNRDHLGVPTIPPCRARRLATKELLARRMGSASSRALSVDGAAKLCQWTTQYTKGSVGSVKIRSFKAVPSHCSVFTPRLSWFPSWIERRTASCSADSR